MAGTPAGGQKAKETNKRYYGKDYYHIIGRAGGVKKNKNKGFAADRQRASEAGKKGGAAGRGYATRKANNED